MTDKTDNPSYVKYEYENKSINETINKQEIEEDNIENSDNPAINIGEEITENNNLDNNIDNKSSEKDNRDYWVKVSIYDAKLEDLTETALVEPMTMGQYVYPLVASIPEEDIYLYGADDGVVLRHGDVIKPFRWNYLTPRFVLPRLKLEDIDKDGVEEIICILYVGSGTGVSIEDLHVLEPDEDDVYRDIYFAPEDYDKQLRELITFEYDKEMNKLHYIAGEMDYEFEAPEVFAEYTFSNNIGFGWIKKFEFEDGITIEDYIAYESNEIAPPVYVNTVTAKVIYQDGSFTITDVIITPPE
jgi:hypothetical protein